MQVSSEVPDFACARCWKHKKKCDKATPTCGRCTTQAATCIYSPLPPKECILTLESTEAELASSTSSKSNESGPRDISHASQSISNANISSVNHESNLDIVSANRFSRYNLDEAFTSQVHDIFTANGRHIESICRCYFETFHAWLPFISEDDFWREFFSIQTSSDPEFSTLLLSIYLTTYIPAQNYNGIDSMDSVYSTTKSAWLHLQELNEPSILLIQSGLLLATFENGQVFEETSRVTMRACVRMGHMMQLHKSLRRNTEADLCGQAELENHRRMWWAIVILERLLAVKDIENGCSFVSQHPTLDDYLPPKHNSTCTDVSDAEILGTTTNDPSELPYIAFADVAPYPALAQATYLLSRVTDYIKSSASISEWQEKEAAILDGTLQAFARSLLRQAAGKGLQGNYCTGFFVSIMALMALHRHDLFQSGASYSTTYTGSPPRSLLAIRALIRMFGDIAKSLSVIDARQLPPFEIYGIYITAVLHIKLSDKSDNSQWMNECQPMVKYLRILQSKWKIAGEYDRIPA